MNIVLASASPRRRSLFELMNLDFTIDPCTLPEKKDNSLKPAELVESIAKWKGMDVARRHSGSLVVAADTLVFLEDVCLGKPSGTDEAFRMLSALSGKSHDVWSGVYIGLTDSRRTVKESFTFSERTKVFFSPLSEEEITRYISTGAPLDKAGAYGIQDDMGALFVKEIRGDYNNVVGFPLHSFYQQLKQRFPEIHRNVFLFQDKE